MSEESWENNSFSEVSSSRRTVLDMYVKSKTAYGIYYGGWKTDKEITFFWTIVKKNSFIYVLPLKQSKLFPYMLCTSYAL